MSLLGLCGGNLSSSEHVIVSVDVYVSHGGVVISVSYKKIASEEPNLKVSILEIARSSQPVAAFGYHIHTPVPELLAKSPKGSHSPM